MASTDTINNVVALEEGRIVTLPTAQEKSEESGDFKQFLASHTTSSNLEPYTVRKGAVLTYRLLFLFVGSIFFGLAYLTFSTVPHSFILTQLQNSQLVRIFISSFSLIIWGFCYIMAFSLRVEQETMRHMVHQVKRKLYRIYRKKIAALSSWKHLPFSACSKKAIELKHACQHAEEKIDHLQEELAAILKRIAAASASSGTVKEALFNQALLDYRSKMEAEIALFDS